MKPFVIVQHSPGNQEIIGYGFKRGLLRQYIRTEESKSENINVWHEIRSRQDGDDLTGSTFIHANIVYTL